MSFSGYLIKLGGTGGDILPLDYMKIGGYKATPNQRMESEAGRAVTGFLHRTTVEHTSTKIEFETPPMTNTQQAQMMQLIKSHFTNAKERRLTIEYYNEEDDDYAIADVYMPDIEYTINRIDTGTNTIYYDSFRVAFIEY